MQEGRPDIQGQLTVSPTIYCPTNCLHLTDPTLFCFLFDFSLLFIKS